LKEAATNAPRYGFSMPRFSPWKSEGETSGQRVKQKRAM
jgi:hypothetical protein